MPDKRIVKLHVHPVVRGIREKVPDHRGIVALDGYVGLSDETTTRLYRTLAMSSYFEFSTADIIESMDLVQRDGAVRVFLLASTVVRVVEISSRETAAQNVKAYENSMEELKNKQQECQTMFENFDQTINQLFNMLSTVLKTVKETENAITRNIR